MPVEPLWREAIGRRLREARRRQRRTLAETAGRAGISTQYLSEVERGRKDPSSEIVAAIAGALGYSLGEVAARAAADLVAMGRESHGDTRQRGPMGPVALAA